MVRGQMVSSPNPATVADIFVHPGLCGLMLQQLGAVDLHGTDQRSEQAQAESPRADRPAHELEDRARGDHRMRQEERFQPRRGAPAVQSLKGRCVERIPIERERADHDDHFDHHQPVEQRSQPFESFLHDALLFVRTPRGWQNRQTQTRLLCAPLLAHRKSEGQRRPSDFSSRRGS
jgi:hypothetical protein